MRAAGNGLVRERPSLPCLAHYRQPELAGLIAVEHAERGHQILHPLERADDAEIQQPEWGINPGVSPRRRPGDNVIVRTVRYDTHDGLAQRIGTRDSLHVEARVHYVRVHEGQQAGHEGLDIAACAAHRSLTDILALVPF